MLAIASAFFLIANFCDAATQNQAEVQCYQYTWVGAKSSNTNSTTCESIKSDSKFGVNRLCPKFDHGLQMENRKRVVKISYHHHSIVVQ